MSVLRYSGKERPLFFLKWFLDLAIRSMVRRTMVARHRRHFSEDSFQLQPSIQPTGATRSVWEEKNRHM